MHFFVIFFFIDITILMKLLSFFPQIFNKYDTMGNQTFEAGGGYLQLNI